MKRIILLISLSILAFSVSGCGNSNNTEISEYIQNVGGDDSIGDGYGNTNKNLDIITSGNM